MEKKVLYRYTGNESQLYGVRKTMLMDGSGKGSSIYEVSTAGGLQMDILPDSGMDIGQLRYKGVNINFMSKNGYDSPERFVPYESNFVNTFPGGMLYTCGLRSVGHANRDGGEWHPLHGRYHGQAASEQVAFVENDRIIVGGVVKESALFGHLLRLTRRILIPAFGAGFTVEDVLENMTPEPAEFMLLYHVNFGYPFLSEKTRLILPEDRETIPRTEFAKTGLGRECTFDPPVDGEEERVFFHKMCETKAVVENRELGIGAELRWSGETLPVLVQWRSMASGDYALGLEPSNNYGMGRADERKNGSLQVLEPFGKRSMTVSLAFGEL